MKVIVHELGIFAREIEKLMFSLVEDQDQKKNKKNKKEIIEEANENDLSAIGHIIKKDFVVIDDKKLRIGLSKLSFRTSLFQETMPLVTPIIFF